MSGVKASAILIFPFQITRLSTFTEVQQEFTRRNYFQSPPKQILPNPSHSGFSLHKRVQSALLLPNRSYKLFHIFSITCHSSLRRQQPCSQVSSKSERQRKILTSVACCKLDYLGCCPPRCC